MNEEDNVMKRNAEMTQEDNKMCKTLKMTRYGMSVRVIMKDEVGEDSFLLSKHRAAPSS